MLDTERDDGVVTKHMARYVLGKMLALATCKLNLPWDNTKM